MEDLNSLYIFSQVVEHNGFTGAARALGVARSSICRRISQLEDELGVRLVQRSTRAFAITDLGMEFHTHCKKMVTEAKAGYEKMACAKAKPSGVIRVSCPSAVVQHLIGPLIPKFIAKHPDVKIAIEATNRKVDLEENFDLSIRVRQIPAEDSGMIMRSLGLVQQVLVASRSFVERYGQPSSPAEAVRLCTLGYGSLQGPHVWTLIDQREQEIQVRHDPKLVVDDLTLIHQAVLQGFGIAQLPLTFCLDEIRRGLVEIVLPEYLAPLCEIQVVFPSRRGLLPAVRSFIDFLCASCRNEVDAWQMKPSAGANGRENVRFFTNRVVSKEGLPQSHVATGTHVDCAVNAA